MPRKYNNEIERALGNLQTRWSDQKYHLNKLIFFKNHNTNPTFTKEHERMKCTIFDIPDCKTCFITGKRCNGVGDHLFEINGYAKYTHGLHGTYDNWNVIPVIGSLNKSYKTKFNNKNIGYEKLTDEDLLRCTEEQKLIYKKITEWKKYVHDCGASLTWKLTEKEQEFFDLKKKQYKELWNINLNDL